MILKGLKFMVELCKGILVASAAVSLGIFDRTVERVIM